MELASHPLWIGETSDRVSPRAVRRTDVHEPQEAERFGFPLATSPPSLVRISAELDEPCLFRMYHQPKLPQSDPECFSKPFCVCQMLESHHEVVRKAHDHHLSPCRPTPAM